MDRLAFQCPGGTGHADRQSTDNSSGKSQPGHGTVCPEPCQNRQSAKAVVKMKLGQASRVTDC